MLCFMRLLSVAGSILGSLLTLVGFFLWYEKVQIHQGRFIASQ